MLGADTRANNSRHHRRSRDQPCGRTHHWATDARANRAPLRDHPQAIKVETLCQDEQLKGDRKFCNLKAVNLLQAAEVRATQNAPRYHPRAARAILQSSNQIIHWAAPRPASARPHSARLSPS